MRLTNGADYAVRCVACLASRPSGSLSTREEVARAMGIPEAFLGKIAPLLAKAGIVELVRGAKGGLRLTRPPQDVSLLDVVEAVMGPISLSNCVLHPESCLRSHACRVHRIWCLANQQLRGTLARTSFETLVARDTCMNDIAQTTATQNRCSKDKGNR